MRFSRQQLMLVGALGGALAATGCETGEDGASCSVQQEEGGALILCDDGTERRIAAPPGSQGRAGADGSEGSAGSVGNDGADGTPGVAGVQGMAGSPGTAGVAGVVGADGTGCSVSDNADGTSTITCDDGSSVTLGEPTQLPPSAFRAPGQPASDQVLLASGLTVEYLTREAGHKADMFSFWPNEAAPTHLVICIEGGREDLGGGKYNPSVQTIQLSDGSVDTVLRGMDRCDGIRTTPWGSVLATEETADGNAYELLNPLDGGEYTIADRGAPGEAAAIVDSASADASAAVIKRTALPTMAWEGLAVLESGVVLGGDELRPGSYARNRDGSPDTDGGAQFKFIPTALRTGSGSIGALSESPLVSGASYALQVKCSSSQYGQGCEVGEGRWIAVDANQAREQADASGATGYYRPEDLHLDPTYAGPGVRFCWANTGNRGAQNWGEVICGVDTDPGDAASAPVVNRFIEGDSELNAPDNLAFQPGTGILYVIEDNSLGDVWACLPDGDDRDLKSDGCVRVMSVLDPSAEPSGFEFVGDGSTAYVSIQHTNDGNMPLRDDYATDDILRITGFTSASALAIASFGADTAVALAAAAPTALGFTAPAAGSSESLGRLASIVDAAGADTPAEGHTAFGEDASALLNLADGLTATFLTRTAGDKLDMGDWWPYGAADPTHAVFCVEGGREDLGAGKFNPSVQIIDLTDGSVSTLVRGMARCDGARVTPWGTVVATEETADGAVYEILNPLAILGDASEQYTITDRGGPGEPASIEDVAAADASDRVVKRTALPAMAWEGLMVLSSGVIVGGDELRPGSYEDPFGSRDTDGGAIFKFVPDAPRPPSAQIGSLEESPLVSGRVFAFQASCRDSRQQFGQGCEVGNGAWVQVSSAFARTDANRLGATGYYRPEDLHLDPTYNGPGARFCWCNTGNASVSNYGEVMCAVDVDPLQASPSERSVWVERVLEGDGEMAAPDNFAFQPVSGNHYIIEDRSNGDIWACLPDGSDRNTKDDGCLRLLALHDPSAEPTGFMFAPDGRSAIFVVQHSGDRDATTMLDDYDTDDVILISGFADPADLETDFGASVSQRLNDDASDLFGFTAPVPAGASL